MTALARAFSRDFGFRAGIESAEADRARGIRFAQAQCQKDMRGCKTPAPHAAFVEAMSGSKAPTNRSASQPGNVQAEIAGKSSGLIAVDAGYRDIYRAQSRGTSGGVQLPNLGIPALLPLSKRDQAFPSTIHPQMTFAKMIREVQTTRFT